MTNDPRWIDEQALILLHAETLAEHGGLEGLREEGLLDSALARAPHLLHYEDQPDVARLTAAYGIGIARNHPFADGNKRAAFLAVGLFLALNGLRLIADKVDATTVMLSVAACEMAEDDFAAWIRGRMRRHG